MRVNGVSKKLLASTVHVFNTRHRYSKIKTLMMMLSFYAYIRNERDQIISV